jgi:hypothetical protein
VNYGDLRNIILTTIEGWYASRYSEKHGLVTSYDPNNYTAKVMFQPQGQESGLVPIETGHIGNGYGIAIGLTPGDGKSTGDQVIVRYQEGDVESGKIVQRVHSDQDKPPIAQSGEMIIYTSGKKIVISDHKGKDAVMVFDGNSNVTVNITNHTTTATANVTVTSA